MEVTDWLGNLNAADVLTIVIVEGIEGDADRLLVIVDQDLDRIAVTTVHLGQDLLDPFLAVPGVNIQNVLSEVLISPFELAVVVRR